MIIIESYNHINRYDLEKLIKEHFAEKKIQPPSEKNIIDTISFFTTFPMAGKIYLIKYNTLSIGYAIIINQWKLKLGGISCKIEYLYVNKNYRKYRPEVNLIEHLIKEKDIYEIEICIDKLKTIPRKIMKYLNFTRDYYPVYKKRT